MAPFFDAESERNERRERRIRNAISEAISVWSQRYSLEMIARLKGEDAMAYRLRGELEHRIYEAIRLLPRPKQRSG